MAGKQSGEVPVRPMRGGGVKIKRVPGTRLLGLLLATLSAPALLAALCCPAWASSPVIFSPTKGHYQLGPHLRILEDPAGKLTVGDLLKPEWKKKFKPVKRNVPNFGFTKSVYWVEFSIKNPTPKKQSLLLEDAYPHHDSVTVYVFKPGGKNRIIKAGDTLPFAARSVLYRNFVFTLTIPANSQINLLMRFKTESSMQLPLNLWKPVPLLEKVNREQVFLGIYFGIMAGMLVYNLFLFGFLRDKNYLFYSLYIASFILAQMGVSRLDLEYLWPNSPAFANLSHPVFFNLTFFFGCLFCKYFLDTKKNTPWLDKIIMGLMGLSTLGVALALLVSYAAGILVVALGSAFLVPVVLIIAGIRCWVKGIVIARYYTVAWVTFLIVAILFNLRNIGVLPSVFITDFSPHIGAAIEVVFLSLALADRINVIERQKRAAQAEALQAQKALAQALERQVEEKNSDIQALSGLLPICASCKNIRDDKGYWQQVESYIAAHSDAKFSHGICPACAKKLYPEYADKMGGDQEEK